MKIGPSSLTITPTTATMMVTNSGPAQTQQFTVSGQVNGQTEDLTTQVVYTVSPSGVVTVDKNGLATSTGTRGGVVTVTASSGAVSATATLTVYYTFTGADPGMTGSVPTDPSSIFTTTTNDTARSPGLVYPNDGVLFPPNITGIEIHFTPGANNTLFEVTPLGQVRDRQRLRPLRRDGNQRLHLPARPRALVGDLHRQRRAGRRVARRAGHGRHRHLRR